MQEVIAQLEAEVEEMITRYQKFERDLKTPCPSCGVCDTCRPQKESTAEAMNSLSRDINTKNELIQKLKNI